MMQGLKDNKTQFLLLALVNAFVGAMVGMERSILPEFGKTLFSLSAASALTSFIVSFGISKAISNYAVGMFRFWRDSGYVIGALISGFLADWMGLNWALYSVAAITAGAGIVANLRMCCTLKLFWRSQECMTVV